MIILNAIESKIIDFIKQKNGVSYETIKVKFKNYQQLNEKIELFLELGLIEEVQHINENDQGQILFLLKINNQINFEKDHPSWTSHLNNFFNFLLMLLILTILVLSMVSFF
jgi:ATP-dependent RNA circularization protein (DNA/RNA ligase family)